MTFVPTKGHAHVKPLLCALKRSYELYGHTMPKIVFTDNVVGDQKLFEDIFPSLIIDVKHVDDITVEVTDQGHELPVYEIPSDVIVDCLSSIDSINFFMKTILNDIRDRRTRKKVFIIQTKHFDVDPTSGLKILLVSLRTLLLTRSITKIGKSIGGDFKKIQRDFHGDFVCLGSLEISTLCKDKDVVARANLSLADVCKAVLSRQLNKDDCIRSRNWEEARLSEDQIKYAAADAYVSLEIYEKVNHLPTIGLAIVGEPQVGTFVSAHAGSSKIILARGSICSKDTVQWNNNNIEGSATIQERQRKFKKRNIAVIEITDIMVPATIVNPFSTVHGFETEKCSLEVLKQKCVDNGTSIKIVIDIKQLRLKSAKPPSTEVPLSSSQNSEDTPVYNSHQTQIISDDIPISVELDMVVDDESEDEERDDEEAYDFTEQNNSTDVDTLLDLNVDQEENNNDDMSNTLPTRVLIDIFHLMDMIKVSNRHGLSKEFARVLRDAIFLYDEEDKRAVEEYLESVDITWDKAMLIKPDWVLKRVRRYVPSPNVLLPVVDNLFNVYGHIKCTVTGFPLFDRHGWKQAKAVLEAIRKGHVSDPPGISFYYLVKRDSRGLPVYRCTRGTNSVEGGINQNIIRKFSSFNAGPFLADCALADCRLRHNISHRSHYNPWLVQALNKLRADVDQEFIPSYADSYGNSHHLVDSNEQFGICPVSQEVIDTFSYLLPLRQDSELLSQGRKLINDGKDFNIQVLTQDVLEASSLVAVKLPTVKMLMLNFMPHNNTNPQVFSDLLRSTKYNKYHYLASRQGIKFALTPVHTYEEYKLYNELVNNHFSAQNLNNYFTWVAISKAWSERDDSKYRDTILANQAQCDMMRSNIRYESRLVNAQRPNTFTHLGSSELSSNVISNDLNVPVIISSLQTPQITRPARIIAPTLMTPIDSSSSFAFQQLYHSPRMQIPRLQNNFTSATTTTTTTVNRGNFYILPPKERKPRTYEAGFNTHMIRGRAWSKVGEPANVTVHKQRGANVSIVGCIAYFGTVNFSKVEPLTKAVAEKLEQEYANPCSKKRKAKDPKKNPLKKGTTAYHIVKFLEATMDTLDKHDKKGFFIVMDNCRVHHSAFVVDAINKRGYKPLFMPPYSPFLNLIEECWSKIKSNIKRNPLDKADNLTSRLPGVCGSVTVQDCQGWIRHAETFWDRCIKKELRLR
ncbi:hypothetical protein INT47_000562 [Mucor saturninus]|uniref:3'-5' exonuclease n=1 Tax=Mucor saturninus TaxID=64648 RepID=A0A8H7V739_9FUNG|nr:hypothetical protein INT47_000562 [Mucor saturninus]